MLHVGTSCGISGLACASGLCTSRALQCQQQGSSLNLTAACPQTGDTTCSIKCADPTSTSDCILLDSNFIDGTPCVSDCPPAFQDSSLTFSSCRDTLASVDRVAVRRATGSKSPNLGTGRICEFPFQSPFVTLCHITCDHSLAEWGSISYRWSLAC